METNITFSFKTQVDGRAYQFAVVAETREEALGLVKSDLIQIISEINVD